MKKRLRIILSIMLPIICITSVCLSFFLPRTKADTENQKTMTETTAEDTGASTADKNYKGGAIYVEKGATYTMRGGTIMGKMVPYGGAVYIANGSTFTMEAGTITGCQAKYGGAIYVEAGGTCNINGGSITGNSAKYAPAIYVENGGTLNINNESVIEDNTYVDWYSPIDYISAEKTVVVGNPSANFSLPYLDFGSYPQTYVGDTMNTTLEDWYSSNSPTSVNTYVVRTRTWEAYEYTDGEIYARGTSYKYSASVGYLSGETIKETGEIAWFKVEPIRWVVLNYADIEAGTAESIEVMSYLALTADIIFYPNTIDTGCNEWQNSALRSWLNGSFYTSAFSKDEKFAIKKATIGNNITGNYNTSTSNSSGTETKDNVYLMSYWDYYNSAGIFTNTDTKRLCSPTDFALSNYCYKLTGSLYVTATYPSGGTCNYWARSAGSSASDACHVRNYGSMITYGTVTVNFYGVRPALQLTI